MGCDISSVAVALVLTSRGGYSYTIWDGCRRGRLPADMEKAKRRETICRCLGLLTDVRTRDDIIAQDTRLCAWNRLEV